MSNYGMNRRPTLARGVRVICTITRIHPAHVSRKTGLLKPERIETHVVSGHVLSDSGATIFVKGEYASGKTVSRTFHPHGVTLESNWKAGITANDMLTTIKENVGKR